MDVWDLETGAALRRWAWPAHRENGVEFLRIVQAAPLPQRLRRPFRSIDLEFSLQFESGRDECRALDDGECSGEPQDTCSSALERSIVRIALETAEFYE